MADYTAKRIDEMEAAFLGGFKRARAELGVESFGMQVIDLPPNFKDFPEHDHAEEGQEEVYLLLHGDATLVVDGEEVPLDEQTLVRVGPAARRKIDSGERAPRLLALGGVPGAVYSPPDVSKLGAPDPMAA